MDLREYLYRHRMTVKTLSELLECSRTYLSEIINGKSFPSKRFAKDVERVTNGEVKAIELMAKKNDTNSVE